MSDRLVDLLLRGEALLDDIDDHVDRWHESSTEEPLPEYLGMTSLEYSLWVEQPASLRIIVAAREQREPVEVFANTVDPQAIAARGVPVAEARMVLQWLKKTGRLPR